MKFRKENGLWIMTIRINGHREEFASKTFMGVIKLAKRLAPVYTMRLVA